VQIRKNTKAYKTIISILTACQHRPDRSELIRLFITKAGQTIRDRIYVEGIQTDAAVFYEMNFQAVLNNLQSPGYQLYASDEVPGIYFLRGSNKAWDETPFEFAEIINKKFAGLPDLPITRKKEIPQKYNLPTPKEISTSKTVGKKITAKATPKKEAKPKVSPAPVVRQPSYHLRQNISFTNLDHFVYPQANGSKRKVLDYYDQVSDYLLPWLKDRPLWARRQAEGSELVLLSAGTWPSNAPALPGWIPRESSQRAALFCHSREHLFFYLECGFIEFAPEHARIKSPHTPDYLLLALDSPGADLTPTLEVVRAARVVLAGLQLPSFIKSDGQTGFHLSIPLDGKAKFDKCETAAGYLTKLIRLKIPQLVTMREAEELTYGKVSIDYKRNQESSHCTAPYSLVAGASPIVAAPLLWDELKNNQLESLTIETILPRLKKTGDPFENFFKKKLNATDLVHRLEEHYSFLF